VEVNTPAMKALMVAVHLLAIALGIYTGVWFFDTFST
jgi:hypothetical protein